MSNILIVYSTTDGHTRSICQRLQHLIEQHGHPVMVVLAGDAATVDLNAFDKIIVGASIRYGKHSRQIVDFIHQNLSILDSKPNAFFSVNVVARKPNKNRPETNPYLKKFLKHIKWKPKNLAVFAGKIDYPRYGFFDRCMIRFIMWLTRGPTDPNSTVEFTDWQQVETFAALIVSM
ncbi:MAG: menaquinone-dependent protoporphyrinogen IX dehydrogenase [Gammaproteobacteria bacterium]